MKIIFSPSKAQITRTIRSVESLSQEPQFQRSAKKLFRKVQKFSQDDLQKIFKTSGMLTQEVFNMYHSGEERGHAVASFTGTSFKQISVDSYTQEDCEFAQDRLLILSGLYGVLRPFDQIREYRLDMNDKIFEEGDEYRSLYNFWKRDIEEYFQSDEVILNLASREYSKMLSAEQQSRMITVDFLIQKGSETKSISVFAKQQRGKMLDWIIKNKIENLSELDHYRSDGFELDQGLSNGGVKVFIKKM